MADDRNRTDWTMFIGIGLVVLGAWLLMSRVFGPWWQPVREMIRFAFGIAWPIALIVLGVLLLTQSRKLDTERLRGRRLYRSRTDKKLAGVLGGVSEYFGVDPTIVRVAYVVFGILTGFAAIVIYIVAAVVVPEAPVGAPRQPVWPGSDGPTPASKADPYPSAPVPAPAPPSPSPEPAPAPPAEPEPAPAPPAEPAPTPAPVPETPAEPAPAPDPTLPAEER